MVYALCCQRNAATQGLTRSSRRGRCSLVSLSLFFLSRRPPQARQGCENLFEHFFTYNLAFWTDYAEGFRFLLLEKMKSVVNSNVHAVSLNLKPEMGPKVGPQK